MPDDFIHKSVRYYWNMGCMHIGAEGVIMGEGGVIV
jgi:hypothetical protein